MDAAKAGAPLSHPDSLPQRRILDALPDLISYVSADGRFQFANRAYQTFFGLPGDQIDGRPYLEVLGPEAVEQVGPFVERALAGERIEYSAEVNYRHAGPRRVETRMIPDMGPRGQVLGFFAIVHDVTERSRQQDEMRAVLDGIEEGFFALDKQGRFVTLNLAAVRMFSGVKRARFARSDLVGTPLSEVFPAWTQGPVEALFHRVLQSGKSEPLTFDSVLAPGRVVSIHAFPTAAGGVGFLLWDTTDPARVQAAARETEARLIAIAENLPAGMVFQLETRPDGSRRFTFISQSCQRLTGLDPEALLRDPAPLYDLIDPSQREAFSAAEARAAAERSTFDQEVLMRTVDGRAFWSRMISAPRVKADGSVLWDGLQIDVTDRRQQMEALRESEARFRLTADSAPAFIWMCDAQGAPTFINRHYAAFFGEPIESIMPNFSRFHHPDDRIMIHETVTTALTSAQPFSLEARYRRHDGAWRWLRCEGAPRLGEHGVLLGFTGCNVDVTEARDARELLAQANQSLADQVVIESAQKDKALLERERFWEVSNDLFAIIDRSDPHPLAVNARAWQATLGYGADQLTRNDLFDLIHPDDWDLTQRFLTTPFEGEIGNLENRLRHADGGWRWLAWNVIRDGQFSYCVARDVTDDRLREAHLRRSQKLEALGQLTGGVAHDFNNLLTAIMGALDLMQKRPDDGKLRERLVAAAFAAAKRGERLNKQLLGFARRRPVSTEFMAVSAMVQDMRPLIRGALGDTVHLELSLEPEELGARVDSAQFEAAMLNLVVNARDAMPDGGRLKISVRSAPPDAVKTAGLGWADYVMVEVSDTGVGMSDETLSHAFEPFFTTKDIGKGTGLGLAQVYGFARQSGGGVIIDSRPGQGARIAIVLPIAERGPEDAAPSEDRRPTTRRRVLLVEDDSLVGVVTENMLTELGHVVTRTQDAEQALDALSRSAFDLLLTDVRMPGRRNGIQLAHEASGGNPRLRVLLCSGWAEDVLSEDVGGALWPMLPKPFDIRQLERAIHEAFAVT